MFLLSLLLIVVLTGVLIYRKVPLPVASAVVVLAWLILGLLSPVLWSLWLVIPLAAVLLVLNVPFLRRPLLSRPVFTLLKKSMPSMSVTEREAVESGTTWWEKEIFSGQPNWGEFAQIPLPQLTAEEQSFLDNEVNELCAMLNEWDIYQRKDLPPE